MSICQSITGREVKREEAANDHWDIDGKVFRNKARYINHSCAPNCEVHTTSRTIWIVALRDIKAGEELSAAVLGRGQAYC